MLLTERFKQYPSVLWALALYLASLGFNFKADLPLAVLAVTAVFSFGENSSLLKLKSIIRHHWHIVVFLMLTLIVTLASKNMTHSLLVQVQLLPALLMYAIITTFATDEQKLEFVITAIVIGTLVTALTFLAQAVYLSEVTDPLEKVYIIKSPLFIAPNDILFLSVIAPLSLYLLISAQSGLIRIVAAAYLVIVFASTIYLQSRQATGVLLFGAFLFFFLLRPLYGLVIVVVGLCGILVVDWLLGQVLVHKLVYLFPRRYVWEAAWQMFLDRPLTGQGPGMFKIYYQEYLGKAGYLLEQVEDRRPMNWAHSLYLEQLAERGVLGLFALLIVVGKPLLGQVKKFNVLNLKEKSIVTAVLAYMAGGVAETSLLRLWSVVVVFLLLAVLNRMGELRNHQTGGSHSSIEKPLYIL